jgi:hypothetical protein
VPHEGLSTRIKCGFSPCESPEAPAQISVNGRQDIDMYRVVSVPLSAHSAVLDKNLVDRGRGRRRKDKKGAGCRVQYWCTRAVISLTQNQCLASHNTESSKLDRNVITRNVRISVIDKLNLCQGELSRVQGPGLALEDLQSGGTLLDFPWFKRNES